MAPELRCALVPLHRCALAARLPAAHDLREAARVQPDTDGRPSGQRRQRQEEDIDLADVELWMEPPVVDQQDLDAPDPLVDQVGDRASQMMNGEVCKTIQNPAPTTTVTTTKYQKRYGRLRRPAGSRVVRSCGHGPAASAWSRSRRSSCAR